MRQYDYKTSLCSQFMSYWIKSTFSKCSWASYSIMILAKKSNDQKSKYIIYFQNQSIYYICWYVLKDSIGTGKKIYFLNFLIRTYRLLLSILSKVKTSENYESIYSNVPGFSYSRVRNKRSPTIINFLTFFQGLRPYSGLHSIR